MQYEAILTVLTHWGQETHICVGNLTIIGSDNGILTVGRRAIIWTNDRILLIWTLGINCSDILRWIHIFSFKNIHFKMSSAKRGPFCLEIGLCLNEGHVCTTTHTRCGCPGESFAVSVCHTTIVNTWGTADNSPIFRSVLRVLGIGEEHWLGKRRFFVRK